MELHHANLDSLSDAELQNLIAQLQLSNPPPAPDVPSEAAYHYNVPPLPLPPSSAFMSHAPPPQPPLPHGYAPQASYQTTVYSPEPQPPAAHYSPHRPPAPAAFVPPPAPVSAVSYPPQGMTYTPLPPLPAQRQPPPSYAAANPALQQYAPPPLPPQPQSTSSSTPMWDASVMDSAPASPPMYTTTPMTTAPTQNGAGLHVQVQDPGAPIPLPRPPQFVNGGPAGLPAMRSGGSPHAVREEMKVASPSAAAASANRPVVSAPPVLSSAVQLKLAEQANARAVDVCFVVDCTGSMSHWIQQVKDKVMAIAKGVKSHPRVRTVRLAFVGYRDYFYPADQRYFVVPFVEDEASFEQVVRSVQALYCKGNDEPEDMLGGLDQALKLDWKGKTRIIILVADAPCHGADFHTLEESSANASFNDPFKADTLLRAMGTRFNIDLTFCRISKDTDLMISKFKPLYDDRRGSGRGLKVIELKTNVDDFLPKMIATITESVNKANR